MRQPPADRKNTSTTIIIINVLIKVTLNEIRCRSTLQSRWSTLADSTSRKAEENEEINHNHTLLEQYMFILIVVAMPFVIAFIKPILCYVYLLSHSPYTQLLKGWL